MTDYAAYQSFATDTAGNVVGGANIEIRSESSGSLVTLFSGRTGGAKSNPFTADSDGYFIFYTVGAFLKIRIYTGPSGAPLTERILRYVPVGLAGGYDVDSIMHAVPVGSASAPGFSFNGDTTTGAYSPGAGIWAVATSGVERWRIDSSGNAALGATTAAHVGMLLGKNITGAVSSYAMIVNGATQSGVTANAYGVATAMNTVAASFTLPVMTHFIASQGAIGAGSVVTNQYGFFADASLTGAANNVGFLSNIAAAANRWNFYGNGTARNFLQGALSIGATTDPGTGGLYVNGTTVLAGQTTVEGQSVSPLTTLSVSATLGTWDCSQGQKAKVTLNQAGHTMAAPTNIVEGTTYFLWVIQDGTGSRTITVWNAAFDFGAAGAPTLTTTANRADLLTFEAINIASTLKMRFTGIARGFS